VTTAPRRIQNPPNPWSTQHVEWLEEPPPVALEVYEEEAHSILSKNESPDVPFTWSVNPYRGCQHACAYCYARPSHQYLGLGAGTDFDSKIVVKRNGPELLREELARPRWKHGRGWIAFSGVTDCYQPLEASYEVTRRMLEVCDEFRHPAGVITKSALIRRDAALLARMARRGGTRVTLSIPFADETDARAIEPWASAPSARFETLRRLAQEGIPVGVAIAPLIPGLNDAAVPEILERAREAGATSAFSVLLRLPLEVRPVFEERLRAAFPGRADKVLHALREMRDGRLNSPEFGLRMVGAGPRYELVQRMFEVHARRLGIEFETERSSMRPRSTLAPREEQGELFRD
jgi:DNA repair photolyase